MLKRTLERCCQLRNQRFPLRAAGDAGRSCYARKPKQAASHPQCNGLPLYQASYMHVWQVFRRADRPDLGKREEEYQLLGEFLKEPGAAEITPLFAPKPKAPTWKTYWKP